MMIAIIGGIEMNICYFCGKQTDSNMQVNCTDKECTERHIICNECLEPLIKKTMREMTSKYKREQEKTRRIFIV
jgi:hypothetical protein